MHILGTLLSLPAQGAMGWPVGLLEPVVAGYALRLYRLLGKRIGWWVCGSFCLLALGHFLQWFGATAKVVGPSISFDLIAFLSPLLLLIGLAHKERTLVQRAEAEQQEKNVRAETETKAQKRVATLLHDREELQEQVTSFGKREKVLEESASNYYLLFSSSPQPMLVFDLRSHRVLAVNNAAVTQYATTTDEFLRKTVDDLFPGPQGAALLKDLARPTPVGQIRRLWHQRRESGGDLEIEITAVDLRYADCPARLVLACDITQRLRAEAIQRRQEKLEALGRVAGAVGEHFGNVIRNIATEAESLLERPQHGENERALKQISAAANRAAVITQQLLTAGGRRFTATEALDLNQFLQGLESKLADLLGAANRLETTYDPNVPLMMGDPALLEQVVLDLMLNARDAMYSGGIVALETSLAQITQGSAETGRPAGEYVRLTLRDTGCGVSPEVQARLFEPFCTTREHAKALGLGLASVYGAVKQLAGWTELATSTGMGTEVTLYFPACAPRPIDRSKIVAPVVQKQPIYGKILLVEPNDRMRQLARSVLEWKGYKVIETDSATLALTIWPGQGHTADLLLVDVSLPGPVSGRELASRLLESKPGLKVIFTCDSPQDARSIESLDRQGFLPKPFTSVDLLVRVGDSLPPSY